MAKHERVFSSQLRKELKQVYGEKCLVQLLPDMRRTGKKPFDFFFVLESRFYAIECKLSKGHSFNIINDIRPHQIPCLHDVEKAGGKGYFIICFQKYDIAFLCSPDWIEYTEEKLKSDSIRFDYFKEHAVEIKRRKIEGRTRWEVEKMVGECL
jgi:penicillin-binding protein-related factor A (putative recombinase)